MSANGSRNQAARNPAVSPKLTRPRTMSSQKSIPNAAKNNGKNGSGSDGNKEVLGNMLDTVLNAKTTVKEGTKKVVRHICVVDTNVLINDWKAIRIFIKGGNLVVLPLTVIKELDKLKTIDRTKREALKALREIDRLQTEGNPFLIVEKGKIFTHMDLDKDSPDHKIIATLNFVLYNASRETSQYYAYDDVKMITDDYTVKILAREVHQKKKLIVEPYFNIRTNIRDKDFDIPILFVDADSIDAKKTPFTFPAKGTLRKIPEGSAIVGYSHANCKNEGEFAAIRKGDEFTILDSNIQAYGITRRDMKVNHAFVKNWQQIIALHYLLDPSINCVFMQGATGSGKTLLAMAAAMELKKRGLYPKIVVYRIPESAFGDSSPWLPGDAGQKIAPWTEPILQALMTLLKIKKLSYSGQKENERPEENNPLANNKKRSKKNCNGNGGSNGNGNSNGAKHEDEKPRSSNVRVFVDDLFDQNGIEIKILDYVRGITIDDAVVIIDDSQNLGSKNIKDIITRGGPNAKMIFTGDLNQIDNKYLNKETSGLAHAIVKLKHLLFVGVISLHLTVRSKLAAAADELL